MRSLLRAPRLALLFAVLLGGSSTSADAQQWTTPRGWIGISFEVLTTQDLDGRRSTVVITEVTEGSPAAEAGLRPGDELVSINNVQGPAQLIDLRSRLHVAPGEEVAVSVRRGRSRIQYQLQAAESPTQAMGQTFTFEFHPDSMVETFSRSMDSLRVRLVQAGGADVRVTQGADGVMLVQDRIRSDGQEFIVTVTPEAVWPSREAQSPFDFRNFPAEAYDSLVLAMESLNREVRQLRAREGERVRTLLTTAGNLTREQAATDTELVRLRRTLAEVSSEAEAVARVMAANSRAPRVSVYRSPEGAVRPPQAPAVPVVVEGVPTAEFRPLTPYLLGRDRTAGAKVLDLQADLAQYFGVDGGVLVAEVPDGTPAQEAGLRPGDVITRVATIRIRSVDELRTMLARSGGSLPLAIIRKGDSLQVMLRR